MVMHAEDLKPPKDLLLFTIEQHSLKLDKILEKIGDIDDRLIRIEERIGFKDKLVISIVNIVTKPIFWWIVIAIGASLNFDYLHKFLQHFFPLK